MSIPSSLLLSGHGTFVESDASATRHDYYPDGDDATFQPELFQQMHKLALEMGNGTYNAAAIQEHFKRRYADSKANNPKMYFNPPSAVATMGAYSVSVLNRNETIADLNRS